MKQGYYFPHFEDARNDRKIKRMRKEIGIQGYAIYFMLLEVLRNSPNFKYPISDIDLLADDFGTTEVLIQAVISKYELFQIDTEQMLFSAKLIENLQPYLAMQEQRRMAGIASAEKRKNKALAPTTEEQPFNDRSTTVQQIKEKEIKEKEIKTKDIETRKNDFYTAILEIAKNEPSYSSDIVKGFFDYWTEHGPNQKKFRAEMEKVFDIKKRLSTWYNRSQSGRTVQQTATENNGMDMKQYAVDFYKTEIEQGEIAASTNVLLERPLKDFKETARMICGKNDTGEPLNKLIIKDGMLTFEQFTALFQKNPHTDIKRLIFESNYDSKAVGKTAAAIVHTKLAEKNRFQTT